MLTFMDTLQTQQKIIVILACFRYPDNVYIEPESNTERWKFIPKYILSNRIKVVRKKNKKSWVYPSI